jgi:hypothetical protein
MNKHIVVWLRVAAALTLSLGLAGAALAQTVPSGDAKQLEIGRRIYLEGLQADGTPLSGTRFGNATSSGNKVACVDCHRPSGLGQVEGDVAVPPIAGNFLFAKPGDKRLVNMDPHISKVFNQAHDPYTEASLAAAILNGVNSKGREMSPAMPRYQMTAVELRALTAYLKQLSAQWSPGVTAKSIRFATVITPDVDPVRRKVFKDMVQMIVRQKNGSTLLAQSGKTRHHMTTASELILGTERKWELDVWELRGAADTWAAQLVDLYHRQPVFALLSGISNGTWQPVHDFCEHEKVPCWFPTLDVPVTATAQYSFYFSGGVALEASALGQHLLMQQPKVKRVIQVYRDEEAGRVASQVLAQALTGSGIAVESRVLKSDMPAALALKSSLDGVDKDAVVMFWLRPDDVQALGQLEPVGAQRYFSSVLAKGEHAPLLAKWRANSHLIYPYELPERRAIPLTYFHAWRNLRKIELVDEALQSEVFFALNFMTDTLSDMLDNLYRDYLVERAESMLGKRERGKAEQETRDRVMLGRPGDMERKMGMTGPSGMSGMPGMPTRLHESVTVPIRKQQEQDSKNHGTTMYPHLDLAPGQRLASKGAYIVRFANDSGEQLVPESELIVP